MQMLRNSFRNKLLSAFYQRNGIRLIPAPSWGDLPHIELFMEGWPKGSVIAINSTGIGLDKRCRYIWLEGYHAMLDILKPIHIMRYGAYIEGERKEMSTYYPNNNKADLPIPTEYSALTNAIETFNKQKHKFKKK